MEAARYWAEKFKDESPVLELYGRRLTSASAATLRMPCDIGPARSQKLRELAETAPLKSISRDLSLFYLFTALLGAYLHRVSGQEKVVIGSPIDLCS